jgi:DNA-binding winged helix-turn-helix (wHTH) protein
MRDQVFRFGPYTLAVGTRTLWRGSTIVSLTPKEFDTLYALIRHAGGPVAKELLVSEIWGSTSVSENNLMQQVRSLRRKLGKDENGQEYIRTVPGHGYFIALEKNAVSEAEAEQPTPISSGAVTPVIPHATPDASELPAQSLWKVRTYWILAIAGAGVAIIGAWAKLGDGAHKANSISVRTVGLPKTVSSVPDRIFARADSESGATKFISVTDSPGLLTLSPPGNEIYIQSAESIQVLNLVDLAVKETIPIARISARIAVSPDGGTSYVGTASGELHIINRKHKTSKIAPEQYSAAIRSLALTANGKHLYMSISRAGVRRYDVDTQRTTVLSSTGCAESLALDEAHNRLFVGYMCGGIGGSIAHDTVDMVDLVTGERSVVFRGPPMVAGPLTPSPTGEIVWVDGLDACRNPQYFKYDLTGCPTFPSDIHHIFRVSDRTLVKTLGALPQPCSVPRSHRTANESLLPVVRCVCSRRAITMR